MTINQASLPNFCEPSSGAVRKIVAIETKDIVGFREPHYLPPSPLLPPYSMAIGDIVLKDGAVVYEWLNTSNQLAFHAEIEENSPQGPSFLQNIGFSFSHVANQYVHWISQLRDKDFIIIYQTTTKKVRVVGTLEQPMKFTTQKSSGSRRVEKQQVVFTWQGATLKPAPFLPVYDLALLFPTASINTAFSLDTFTI